jgi:hypothetical protein
MFYIFSTVRARGYKFQQDQSCMIRILTEGTEKAPDFQIVAISEETNNNMYNKQRLSIQ